MYLMDIGFYDFVDEAPDCFRYWEHLASGYQKAVNKNCLIRHMLNNGRFLLYQECYGDECDEEHGKIIDYCLRGINKIFLKNIKLSQITRHAE